MLVVSVLPTPDCSRFVSKYSCTYNYIFRHIPKEGLIRKKENQINNITGHNVFKHRVWGQLKVEAYTCAYNKPINLYCLEYVIKNFVSSRKYIVAFTL